LNTVPNREDPGLFGDAILKVDILHRRHASREQNAHRFLWKYAHLSGHKAAIRVACLALAAQQPFGVRLGFETKHHGERGRTATELVALLYKLNVAHWIPCAGQRATCR
jgi:hypothetical protein